MTYKLSVSGGTLNPTHSLTRSLHLSTSSVQIHVQIRNAAHIV